jgi:hypothetical protein
MFIAEDFPGLGRTVTQEFTGDSGISQQNSNSPASKSLPRITSESPKSMPIVPEPAKQTT